MAIYAIGDVQGCYDSLARLLDHLKIDTATDEIWFVGDLVNRGPKSEAVLERVMSLGKAAVVTLGNHDLHLLALAAGKTPGAEDRQLAAVLDHAQADRFISWLRRRPLVHYRPDLNTLMVHAGVIPDWNPLQIVKLAREVETVLQGPNGDEFLRDMYGEQPDQWNPELSGTDRLRFIVNCLTRIRFCHADGGLDFVHKGPPGSQPEELTPWFQMPMRAAAAVRIVFGHWASLGLLQHDNLIGLDTGCVWGRQLTAVRLNGPTKIFNVPAINQ
jgi:bis(5'-nucleosyl)-tetraphosphatase (symmetrical)